MDNGPEQPSVIAGGVRCPACGAVNSAGSAQCRNCGAGLPEPAATQAPPAPPWPADARIRRCPTCGSPNAVSATQCRSCGTELTPIIPPPPAPEAGPQPVAPATIPAERVELPGSGAANIGPMGIGQCLDRTFAILRHGFGAMVLAATIVVVPMALCSAVATWASYLMNPQFAARGGWGAIRNVFQMMEQGPMGPMGGMRLDAGMYALAVGSALLVYIAMLFTYPVLWGVVTMLAAQAHLGRRLDPRAAWRGMRRNYWPLVGVVLVYGVALMVSGMCCYIPALFVMPLLLFLVPAVIFEERGPFQAVSRSAGLVAADYGRMFGWCVLSWLLVGLASSGLSIGLGFGVGSLAERWLGSDSAAAALVTTTVQQLAGLLYLPVLPVFRTLAYFDARSRLEAFDLRVRVGETSAEAPA